MKNNRLVLFLWVFIAYPILAFAGNAEIWIERADMNQSRLVYIGDEIKFNIMIDTQGERITGVTSYITIDPEFLQPVFPGDLPFGKPFTPGRFLEMTGDAVINSTHQDSLHLSDQPGWGNGIDDFQMDYYQSTGSILNGVRPSVRGTGIVASFILRVVGMPDNANDSTAIVFDFKNDDNRLTTYYKLDEPSNEQRFGKYMNYSMFIAGFRIYPEFPDTLIAPGTNYELNLNNHVTSNSDNFEISWSMTEQEALSGAVPTLDDTLVTVTTTPTTKGVLKLNVRGVQKNTNYVDSQEFTVGVDHVPEFHSSIPTVTFNEDEVIMLSKSYFFTDLDDDYADIEVTPGSSNLVIEEAGDSIRFAAAPNWSGNSTAELVVQDPVQRMVNDTTRATININVLPINDPPELDFSELDPIPVFYGVVKQIIMQNGVHVNDVDDTEFTWSVESMNTDYLVAEFVNDNVLRLEALNSQFSGNVDIKITVMDDEMAMDSSTVTVNIQPTPVKLLPIPTIIVISGQSKDIFLDNYVDYPSNIKSELIWSFEVLDSKTLQEDTNVILSYNSDQQVLTISAIDGHLAIDELYVTVSAGNENRDSGKTLLKVLSENQISIFPFPQVTIMQGMDLDVLDLNDYVVDPLYSIDELSFGYSGGDSLKGVRIDSLTHKVTISADTVFLGLDSLNIVAQNPDGDIATQKLYVNCIEYNPNPVFMTPLPDAYYYWKMLIPQEFVDLDDYVWDFSTPDSSIIWRIDYNHLYLDIVKTEENLVKISTFDKIGDQMVIFTATNLAGYSTSDTVIVTIAKRGEPVWRTIPPIEISSGQIYSSLYLNRFCIAGGNEITFSAEYDNRDLNVNINSNTTQVTISGVDGFSGTSPVIFKATNQDTSSVSNLINVTVSRKTNVSCFFNSIVSNKVNFVINADANVSDMGYSFKFDGDSLSLNFKMIDSTETQKIWTSPFILESSGLYKLNLEFDYASGLTVKDSLWLTTILGKGLGKTLASSDRQLLIDIPETTNERDVYILKETNTDNKVYTLSYNGPGKNIWTRAKPSVNGGSSYYSFYYVENGELFSISTSTDGDGMYYASIETDKSFTFGPSDMPATEEYVLKAKIASYPNPFNSRVKIRYLLNGAGKADVRIYNILGQAVLVHEYNSLETGIQEFSWDGTNKFSNPVPSGVYFIQIHTRDNVLTQKVLLIR